VISRVPSTLRLIVINRIMDVHLSVEAPAVEPVRGGAPL
jgi:hypothetical protein